MFGYTQAKSDDAYPGQADLTTQGTKKYYKKQNYSPFLMNYLKKHPLLKSVSNDNKFKIPNLNYKLSPGELQSKFPGLARQTI